VIAGARLGQLAAGSKPEQNKGSSGISGKTWHAKKAADTVVLKFELCATDWERE